MRREIWTVAGAGVLLLCAHLLPLPTNGRVGVLPTICPLKIVSGWPCPGCGATRSLVFSAHGDWSSAFTFHPLGPIFYGILWFMLLAGVLRLARKPQQVSERILIFAGSTVGAALLISWVLRMAGVLPYPANF